VDFEERLTPTTADVEKIRARLRHIAGARITVAEQEEGPPTGAPINIELSGDDFGMLGQLAEQVRLAIARMPHVEDVQDDYVAGLPSVRVRIDRQKAALFDLSSNAIGAALKTAYNGLDVSTYYEGDEDYDITITLAEENRRVMDVLHKLMIPTPAGPMVPLTTLAKVDYSGSVGDIVRIDHDRVVTVKAHVDEERIPGAVARVQAEKLLADFPLPAGYTLKFTGENEFQKESEDFLGKAFVVSLLLIFLILVAMFNSVSQPLIILTSVVLSLGGAFLGLTVLQEPFGIIMSGVGLVSLVGVVVNNALVLIDYTNQLRSRGMALDEAVVAAGATRLRAVIMGSVCTVLGVIPMIAGVSYDFHQMAIAWQSESTLWWRTMSTMVAAGLMVSTLLTLVVVPVVYALVENSKLRLATLLAQIKAWYLKPFAQ
jgi:multidrug efflux pump subunit AcrB